jgi:hypothetical protein
MDRSAVKKIVDREIEPLMARLGIPHWRITVGYKPAPVDDDGVTIEGECKRGIDYNNAYIELNPEGLDGEEDVIRILRHELFHVVLSPFDLYSTAVAEVDLPRSLHLVLDRVWRHAVEKAAINLERMYLCLTDKPDESPPDPHAPP